MTTGCFLTLPLPKPEQVVRYADELMAMGYVVLGVVEMENGFVIRYRKDDENGNVQDN